MSEPLVGLGNQIFRLLNQHQASLFDLGRSAQLAYIAFQQQGKTLSENPNKTINLTYPVGLKPDGSIIPGQKDFPKEALIDHYKRLSEYELGIMCTYHLVTQTEVLLTDLVTAILKKYPKKLGAKKQTSVSVLFEATSIEAAREAVISSICNELSYLSPKEYADSAKDIFGFSLLEIPAYHRYLEVKATRDVFIHNRGIANSIYEAKAGSHARCRSGIVLPMNSAYFLQCYECCLALTEMLMKQFNEIWPSEEFSAWHEKINKPSASTQSEAIPPPLTPN
jgi:hypothetical protein